jgi:hypothetical protein
LAGNDTDQAGRDSTDLLCYFSGGLRFLIVSEHRGEMQDTIAPGRRGIRQCRVVEADRLVV